jgi:hypothetical protein
MPLGREAVDDSMASVIMKMQRCMVTCILLLSRGTEKNNGTASRNSPAIVYYGLIKLCDVIYSSIY